MRLYCSASSTSSLDEYVSAPSHTTRGALFCVGVVDMSRYYYCLLRVLCFSDLIEDPTELVPVPPQHLFDATL